MTNSANSVRALMIYGLILPIALILGYMLATPLDLTSFSAVGLVLILLLTPILMRWHQPLLFLSWNTTAVVFFLPGHPNLWLLTGALSLGFSIFKRALSKEMKFLPSASVVLPILALAAVVLFTAHQTGGMGLRVFGSESVGGRRYYLMFGAIIGLLAMVAERIPLEKANLYTALYLLGALTAGIGMLLPYVRPEFYFVFWLFPIQDTIGISSVTNDVVEALPQIERYYGIAIAAMGVCFYLIARHGIRGVLNLKKYWRLGVFLAATTISLFGGFRSFFVLFLMTFAFAFLLEGLLRTRLFWVLVTCGIGLMAVILPVADKLPLPVQRTLSILPFVDVSPIARYDARGSSDWRFAMWQILWPQVPQYLILGKGLQINALDLDLANELVRRGAADSAEVAMLAGDYHSGPLSTLIPFGLPGTVAFLWLLAAGGRALFLNYRYGLPEHRSINTFLLAFFLARVLLFFFVFGSLYSDLAHFAGLLGFSISLNGGICRPGLAPVPAPRAERPRTLGALVPVGSR